MSVVHISYASDGGAGRAARRTSLACTRAGMSSSFAFVHGDILQPDDVKFGASPKPTPDIATRMKDRLQWEFIPQRRTALSNTLFSVAYPGIDVARSRVVETADVIHLHWPTWTVTPRAIGDWLTAGRTVFWTLHDVWAMTGGCHYPSGCEQFHTMCMKCPQMHRDRGLVGNSFAEKLAAYGSGGNLHLVTPSAWMAQIARDSAIFRNRPVHVVANPVELDVFRPTEDRPALRAAFGVTPRDAVVFLGSFDLSEQRKGAALLYQALQTVAESGDLSRCLPPGGTLHLVVMGKSEVRGGIPGIRLLSCGQVDDDAVMADLLNIADLVAIPSLEDNYPNLIVEAMACGTPCLGFPIGGVVEMITDGVSGVLAETPGSVPSLAAALLRFLSNHVFDSEMRLAVRALAERRNNPEIIGGELAQIYRSASGRSFAPDEGAMRKRMLAALAHSAVPDDPTPGGDLLRFPMNMALAELLVDRQVRQSIVSARPAARSSQKTRVLAVRTVHEHHSARSGPYQFVRHLSPERYAVSSVAVPLGAELAGEGHAGFRKAGLLLGVKPFGQQGNAWLAEAEILARCASEPIDIVHYIDGELAGWLLPSLPPAMFAGGRRPVFIATFHQPPAILAGMVNAEALARMDGIITLCESQASALRHYVDPSRVFVIPHGIDTTFFHPSPVARLRSPQEPFRLLLVGHWLRDLAAARVACARIRAAGLRIALTVVSPDPSLRDIDPETTFLSGLSDEALRAAYWDADALFLPLLDATANNAVLEAMACGLPVISTQVGGVPDAVGAEAGILCPPGDANALAAAVLQLADCEADRLAMGAAGRLRAEAQTWETVARQHEAIYPGQFA